RSDLPLDAFLGLFAAGLFLGALRLRFGHIAVGAGFHAGWVLVMKLHQEYTDVVPGSKWSFVEGAFGGTMGYLGLAWLGLLGAAVGGARVCPPGRAARRRVAGLAAHVPRAGGLPATRAHDRPGRAERRAAPVVLRGGADGPDGADNCGTALVDVGRTPRSVGV